MSKEMLLKGCGAGSAALLQDAFTGADGTNLTAHAMDLGGGWTAVSGVAKLLGNRANADTAGADGKVTYQADAGRSDVTVQATVNLAGASNECGLVFRYQDANNFWALSGYAGDGKLYLYEVNGGTTTQRAAGSAGVTSGVDFVLKVVLSGTGITAYKDGTQVLTYTSASFQAATRHGLRSWQVTNKWDDFQVSSP
jgi:hypothetical protein